MGTESLFRFCKGLFLDVKPPHITLLFFQNLLRQFQSIVAISAGGIDDLVALVQQLVPQLVSIVEMGAKKGKGHPISFCEKIICLSPSRVKGEPVKSPHVSP